MDRQIPPENADIGMYVKAFGGSWFSHPFWRSGFVIKTQREVDKLRSSSLDYIIIDEARGSAPKGLAQPIDAQTDPVFPPKPAHVAKAKSGLAKRVRDDQEREEAQRKSASILASKSRQIVESAFSDARLGRAINVSDVRPVVDDIVESIEDGSRALLEVLRLKKKSEYTYLHSVAVCTLMVSVAKYLEKDPDEVRAFGLAGLLHDVGKVGIPDEILDKQGKLTDDEYRRVKYHAEYGYQLLAKTDDVPGEALDVCRHHHERIDGAGYPFGLTGDAISQVAKLGAICDVYDALTSERAYKDPWSPTEALGAMWHSQGQFDRELLFAFMHSLGLFVPHMIVELSDKTLALVVESSWPRPHTKLLVFYDTQRRDWVTPKKRFVDEITGSGDIVAPADLAKWGLESVDAILAKLWIEPIKLPSL